MARIYVSSTFKDLKECRDQIIHLLRRMRHEVVAMEDYTAEGALELVLPRRQWDARTLTRSRLQRSEPGS